jgi:hypothetical protein
VEPETLLVPSLKLEKISAKPAVGVPVQRRFDADVIIRLNALTSCWERAPCTERSERSVNVHLESRASRAQYIP